ncbi:hypothetical protein JK365_17075 [Salmonella enterica subsp. enterica serovar Ceyco]|uniref:hypothetical protein n=1 Tax=Salmonella enterica TaxID=28901 RepID=UPI0019231E54|nr:hypothetical protein [Salmonella enterica subsp. enterica serovar Ceyco]
MLPILPFSQVVEDEPLHERLKVKWALLSPQTIDVEALTINERTGSSRAVPFNSS